MHLAVVSALGHPANRLKERARRPLRARNATGSTCSCMSSFRPTSTQLSRKSCQARMRPTCWNGSGVHTRRLMRAGRPSRLGNTAPPQLQHNFAGQGRFIKHQWVGWCAGEGSSSPYGREVRYASSSLRTQLAPPRAHRRLPGPASRPSQPAMHNMSHLFPLAPSGRIVELRHVHALHSCGQAEQSGLPIQPLGPALAQAPAAGNNH